MRKFIILALILGVLGATAYGGRKVYRHWKTQRAVKQAKDAFARSDYNKALLWLRQAISSNGRHLEAVRLMGDYAELTQAPTAVFWRQRLLDIDPSLASRLMLARAAVYHRDFEIAKKALDGVDEAGRKTADYHKFLGGFAIATGKYLEAEKSFSEAIKIEPENPIPQLSLASIRIQRTNSQMSAEGRRMLEGLTTNAFVRPEALRHLVQDAMRHTNYVRAMAFAGELVKGTNFVLSDRLIQLDAMRVGRNPQFLPTLANLQQQVATNAPQIFELGRWMMRATGPVETLRWLQGVSGTIRSNLPVTMVVADCYLASSNWTTLQAYVAAQQWGELEYLRASFSSRALREQNLITASRAEWAKAIKAAAGGLDRLGTLERLAAVWNWPVELEEVLWQMINKAPAEKVALQTLSQMLYLTGKTRSLLTLYAQGMKADPKDQYLKNNLASIALLLNAEDYKPHELAREVYEKQPENPAFVATYAYSLYLQKKPAEAAKLMDLIHPEYLEQPSVAGYYAVILAATGDRTKAKKFMEIASKGRFLPEETALFQRTQL